MAEKKVKLEGYDYFFWKPYEEQTKIKHQVLKEYFDRWVKIVGQRNPLNFFDCFAGSGAYLDKDESIHYGSPILAADIIARNQEQLGRTGQILVIDNDAENIENLKKIWAAKKIPVKMAAVTNEFDTTINSLLDQTKGNLRPTFFFIDPFGFTIKMSTLHRILKIQKSEILLNFMFNNINRFLIDDLEETLNNLFGGDEWKCCRDLEGAERENKLVHLFRQKLKSFSKFVMPYRISFPDRVQTYYYLFHCTNHLKGCVVMKASFAKVNNGKVEYAGPYSGQLSIAEAPEAKKTEIEKLAVATFAGQIVTFDDLVAKFIDTTPFLESDIRKGLLAMEKEGKVSIERISSAKRGLKEQDRVTLR